MSLNLGGYSYPPLDATRLPGLLREAGSQSSLPSVGLPSAEALGLGGPGYTSQDLRQIGYDLHLGSNQTVVQQPMMYSPYPTPNTQSLYHGLERTADPDAMMPVFYVSPPAMRHANPEGADPFMHIGALNYILARNAGQVRVV
jgi:hypothetical protein